MSIDPATLAIVWHRLIYVAEEQAKTLVRVSFTSQSGEMQDIASAVFDAQGNMLAEGITGTVGVITALLRGLKQVVREYPPETLAPGDVLIGNDPWVWSGHTFDLAIVRPVFWGSRLLGFTATITHLTDIGGKGWATSTADIYEEGVRLPILKLFRQGEPNQDIFRILRLNVRTPEDVEGDILAQVTATEVGAQRMLEIVREYELEGLEEIGQEICARSEAATREALATVPPGVYQDEVYVGGFGEPLRLAASVRAEGDRMVVDYAGSSPQIPRGINSSYNYTLAHTVFALKSALCPDIPNNEGSYRPITLQAPEGCIVNAAPPAPLVNRHVLCTPINRVIMGALAQAIPERVIADSGTNSTTPSNVSGVDAKGRRFQSHMTNVGAMGASGSRDGYNATCYPSNIAVVPAEILENRVPVLVLSRHIVADSGGAGRYRGGCGLRLALRWESPLPGEVRFAQTREQFPPRGRLAGHSGKLPECSINEVLLPSERVSFELTPGDVVVGETTGGGGFYPPEQREPEKVLQDVIDGYVSVAKAREAYKVAIDEESMAIDWDQTLALRGSKAHGG